jgi:hypothetical protein
MKSGSGPGFLALRRDTEKASPELVGLANFPTAGATILGS